MLRRGVFSCTPALPEAALCKTQLRHHRFRPAATTASAPKSKLEHTLKAVDINPEKFERFGQVVTATHDGKSYDDSDAQLQLDRGRPRFYIMRLPSRGLSFDRITFHREVTQCLGGLQDIPWYLAVAAPTGSLDKPPTAEDIVAFRIPHGTFVKLDACTWHAGPLFDQADSMDFYNLELSDTNVVDHFTHDFSAESQTVFRIAP